MDCQRARELLGYEPATGRLSRRVPCRYKREDDIADRASPDGYRRVTVDGRTYLAHRIIWLLVHGQWPSQEIDHINGIRDDNRLMNLREADRTLNARNTHGLRRDNRSGHTGVYPRRGRWEATITEGGVSRYLGHHETVEAAVEAYANARRERDRGSHFDELAAYAGATNPMAS